MAKYKIPLLLLILSAVFFFGLRPKGYDFKNHVSWLKSKPGIRFSRYGIAYTQAFPEAAKRMLEGEFSLILAFRPERQTQDGFSFLLAVHDGDDRSQLIVAQWRTSLVVMNDNDYRHIRKIPRIVLPTESSGNRPLVLAIVTGKEGTRAYLNGVFQKANPKLMLKIPQGAGTRLVLGNSVYGINSWKGDIYGLAFYDAPLTEEAVRLGFQEWTTRPGFTCSESSRLALCYAFDEKQGTRVRDHAATGLDLKVPENMKVLQKRILSLPGPHVEINESLVADILVNFAGFMPLGIVLSMALSNFLGLKRFTVVAVSVLLCLNVSLFIEVAQAWMPSRSSSLMDLVLNAAGGTIGAFVYGWGGVKYKD